MKKSEILIESKLQNLKPNDHIFSADFVSDEEGDRLEIKEFEFVKYLNKDTKIDIETKNSILAEIFDIRFPKVHSKTDISYGFFTKKEDAAESFVKMINHIHKVVNSSYKHQFC
jgi:hypothetical protein